MPICTLILTVWSRGYLEATYIYQGETPPDRHRLTYRRGTTDRHHPKHAEIWAGGKLNTFKAECIPSRLKEWQEMVLPQNGFEPLP